MSYAGLPRLTAEQQAAVQALDGAYLMLAPAGSGKTETLAARLLHALERGLPAERMLCVTFTNRAAEQMRARLLRLAQQRGVHLPAPPLISTFHGLCVRILHAELRRAALAPDFLVYDDADSTELLHEISGQSLKEAGDLYYQIQQAKSAYAQLPATGPPDYRDIYGGLTEDEASWAREYEERLRQRHALDFAGLVLETRLLLCQDAGVRAAWAGRFDLVQVDEAQDTHLSEYDVVRALAEGCRRVALIGDPDQTIYEWRGSNPEQVFKAFEQDFGPVAQLSLSTNFRATQTLVVAAESFAQQLERRRAPLRAAADGESGGPVTVHRAASAEDEAAWIAATIDRLIADGAITDYGQAGVLARMNGRCQAISAGLQQRGVPHLTVEQFEFFRRQEVKDALAYLRILHHPQDMASLRRVLQRPARGIGDATIGDIREHGRLCGARLGDLLHPETLATGDPHAGLLDAWHGPGLVVFDVETTGTDVARDEIIEIAAVKVRAGAVVERFHTYLRPSIPVGASEAIHGLNDALLAAHGRPPAEALHGFLAFAGDALLSGYNVGFDLAMVRACAARLGWDLPEQPWVDALDLAQRFIRSSSYKLATLAQGLALPHQPSHRAMDDVLATVDLLAELVRRAASGQAARRELVAQYHDRFAPLAQQVHTWRAAARTLRPPVLLARVLRDSGLEARYAGEPHRQENLQRLLETTFRRDREEQPPLAALADLLRHCALAHNVDSIDPEQPRVIVTTVHQAKGLEFDTVFVAGMTRWEFSLAQAQRRNEQEEAKRIFYVAMTRASRRLFLTSHAANEQGYPQPESDFISAIDRACLARTPDSVRG